MQKENIEKITSKLEKVFEGHEEVLAVYIFGSQAEDYTLKDSDLDIAVFVESKKNFSKRKLLKQILKADIGFPADVDLSVVDFHSPPIFLFQIIKTGICIYSKRPETRAILEGKIMHIYYDNQHLRNIYSRYLKKSFEEGTYASG